MKNRTSKICVMGIAAVAICGCSVRPHAISAQASRTGDIETITLRLSSSDAAQIKLRQMYFSLVVVKCEGNKAEDRFPMEPYISGQKATRFKYLVDGKDVEITGTMPADIFDRYDRPCALLQGGGYFSGNLTSVPTPIITRD